MDYINRIKGFFTKAKSPKDTQQNASDYIRKRKSSNYASHRRALRSEVQQSELRNAITHARQNPYYWRTPLLEIFEHIELEGQVIACTETRINKVLEQDFVIAGADKSLFEAVWFENFVNYAMNSLFYGYSAISVVNNKGNLICEDLDRYFVNPDLKRLIADPNQMVAGGYIDLQDCSDVILVYKNNNLGLYAGVARYAIWSYLAGADWAGFGERFGTPMVFYRTDSTDEAELMRIDNMLSNFGNNSYAIGDKRDIMEILQATKTDAHQVYSMQIDTHGGVIAKILLGQTLTTDAGTTGTYAQGKVHQDILESYTYKDLRAMQYVINDLLMPHLVKIGYLSSAPKFQYTALQKAKVSNSDNPKINKHKNFTTANHANAANDLPNKSLQNDFQEAIKNAAKTIFEQGKLALTSELMQPLTMLTYNKLLSAFEKQKNYGSDPEFTQAVKDNLFVFSGYKTYEELRTIADLLLDEDGIIRPYKDFLAEVIALGNTYNRSYLRAEYNHAISSAQSIRRWKKFEEEKADYDLVFDAVNDSRTRPTHRSLDGIIRPVDDGFWNTHTPPLDWGCRCFLRQVPKGTAGEKMPDELPELKPMFATNPAKTGVIFPESHPYFDSSKSEKKEIDAVIKDMKK